MSNYVKTKNVKKASTFVLTTSILMGSVYPAFADTNTSKDEVVYVKLNNNGNVDNVYVVNSFDVKNGEKIVDYGRYSNVLNLSTSDKLNYSSGVVDVNVSDTNKKFYYTNPSVFSPIVKTPTTVSWSYETNSQAGSYMSELPPYALLDCRIMVGGMPHSYRDVSVIFELSSP